MINSEAGGQANKERKVEQARAQASDRQRWARAPKERTTSAVASSQQRLKVFLSMSLRENVTILRKLLNRFLNHYVIF